MTGSGPGPESVPAQGHDFAEFVRRALHAAADQVEPRGGLEPSGRSSRPGGRPDPDTASPEYRRSAGGGQ